MSLYWKDPKNISVCPSHFLKQQELCNSSFSALCNRLPFLSSSLITCQLVAQINIAYCTASRHDTRYRLPISFISLQWRHNGRWPVNFPHKWPVTRKVLPFDDAIMIIYGNSNFPTNKLLNRPPFKTFHWLFINNKNIRNTNSVNKRVEC